MATTTEKNFGSALAARQPEMRHIDNRGDIVEADSPESAYAVNMSDPGALNFIESIKAAGGAKPKETAEVPSSVPSTPAKATKNTPAVQTPAVKEKEVVTTGKPSKVETVKDEAKSKADTKAKGDTESKGDGAETDELSKLKLNKNIINSLRSAKLDSFEKIGNVDNETLCDLPYITANNVGDIRAQIAAASAPPATDGKSADGESTDGDESQVESAQNESAQSDGTQTEAVTNQTPSQPTESGTQAV